MAIKAIYKVTLVRVNDGEKGDPGTKGIGASEIVEQYYLSTSSTSQAGGSWATASPIWSSGHYIWTRSKITWTDGTTTYTTPVLANAMNKANETASDAKSAADSASKAVTNLDNSLTQQEIFNRLTNNGQTQGIYLRNGKLYINGSYIQSGTISADLLDLNTELDLHGSFYSLSGRKKLWLYDALLQGYDQNGNRRAGLLDLAASYSDGKRHAALKGYDYLHLQSDGEIGVEINNTTVGTFNRNGWTGNAASADSADVAYKLGDCTSIWAGTDSSGDWIGFYINGNTYFVRP